MFKYLDVSFITNNLVFILLTMKATLFTLGLLLSFTIAFAQQAKVDDALLLDYYQTQHYQEAVDYLKKMFPEPVTDVKVLSKLAYTTQMANKLPEAQAYYQRIYDIDTTNEAALFSIANINMKRGNSQKAEMFFKRILAKDTTSIYVYTNLAAIAANKKDTLSAVNYLQKANKLNCFDVDIAVDLSGFYISQKSFDKALIVLNKAAESDPDNVFILQKMVSLLYKEKKFTEVIPVGQKLIILDAADANMLYDMGVSYYSLKNYACGAEVLSSIKSIDRTEFSCYFAALCFKGLKDYNQSVIWINNALAQAISPNTSAYYGEVADNNEKMKLYKKAIAAYQKALQFKEDPAIYYAMATLYEIQLKDKATAKVYYKKAAAGYQKDIQVNATPMTYYSLANLYDTQLKDTANAVKYYKKYLDAKPPQKEQNYVFYTKSRIDQLQPKN